jgi:hypothetical protein
VNADCPARSSSEAIGGSSSASFGIARPLAAVCGEQRAGGKAVEERRTACLLDQRGKVLDFALDGVRRCVRALAAPAAIVVVDGEVPREQADEPVE